MSLTRRDLLSGRWSPAEPEASARRVARIEPRLCVAFCATCVERCPVPGALVRVEGRPAVTAACDGCGLCLQVCPSPFAPVELAARTEGDAYSTTVRPEGSIESHSPFSLTRATPSSKEPASS